MRKLALTGLKLGYYLQREGVTGLAGRVRRTLDHQEMTYARYQKKHHIDGRRLVAEKQWLDAHPWPVRCILFEGTGDKIRKSLEVQMEDQIEICDGACIINGTLPEDGYVILAHSDVTFAKNALFLLADQAQQTPEAEVIYGDHDLRGEAPFFKPDFNRVLQLTSAYIGPVIVVKAAYLKETLDSMSDVPVDYWHLSQTLILQAKTVAHISHVLYRLPEAVQISSEQLAAIDDVYLQKAGIRGWACPKTEPGLCRIRFEVDQTQKISIIIPNRNHVEDLKKCLQSIWQQDYMNIEVIIVENGSDDAAVFDYYEELKSTHDNLQIVMWDQAFNYSAVNNYGVAHATGAYLLFLNNDVVFHGTEVLSEMMGWCAQTAVGAVGIKLLYPDDTIQHGGVIVGYGGIAGHAFLGCQGDSKGYMNRLICAQNYSAVTAACMMVKRSCFDRAGGFDEAYQIAWNDIDFCLKVRELGCEIVFSPEATATHYESKSRGSEDTCRKMIRYNSEVSAFRKHWMDMICYGDPAYNPNLSLYAWDFRIG